MAQNLEVLQRQIGETSVRIPDGSAFGELQRQLGGAQRIASGIGESMAVEKAALEGAKQREEGKKPKLAKGINKATATFNQAYRNMDLNMSYLDGSLGLEKGYTDASAPGVLSAESLQNYGTYSDQVIKSAMQNADEMNRPELAFRLKMKAANNELKLQDSLNQKIYKDQGNLGKASLLQLNKDYLNAVAGGHELLGEEIRDQMLKEIDSQTTLGYLNPLQSMMAKNAVSQTEVQANYKKLGEMAALRGSGQAEQQLQKLIKESPENLGLTPEEHDLAIESFASASSSLNSKLQQQQAINFAFLKDQIESRDENGARNGGIQSYEDLDIAAADKTNPVTALQYYQLRSSLRKNILSDINKSSKAATFWQKAQAGGGIQNNTTKEEREAGWVDGLKTYQDAKRRETNNPDYQLTVNDEADLAIQTNTPIEMLTSRIDYALQNANLETEIGNVQWALGFGQKVGNAEEGAPNVLSKISPKSRAILNMANEAMAYSANPDVAKVVEGARLAANPDSPTLEARLKQMSKRTSSELQSDFKSIFGGNADVESMEYGAFVNQLAVYMPISESYDSALSSVKQQLWPSFGVDPAYGEKGKVTYLPPNKTVPHSTNSFFYKNQVNFKVEAALERNFNSDDVDATDKVEWLGKKVVSGNYSQDQVYSEDLYQKYTQSATEMGVAQITKRMGRWRGMDIQLYTEADQFSRIQDNNKIKRKVYFRSPVTNEKVFIKDPGNVPGKETVTDGSGYLVLFDDQLSEMLPEAYEQLTEEGFNEMVSSALVQEFKQEPGLANKIPIARAVKFNKFAKDRKPDLAKRLRTLESKKEKPEPQEKGKKINIFEEIFGTEVGE